MPKGAKKGENRFSCAQAERQNFRVKRIKTHVVPRLKALAGKVSINGQTPFCKLCADIYNEDLPVNEKKIGYRTLEQNMKYWEILGSIFNTYWRTNEKISVHRNRVLGALTAIESNGLKAENKRLSQEVDALRAALRTHGAEESPHSLPSDSPKVDKTADFDRVCRALMLVIDSSEEIFEIHEDEMKITCNLTDLNPDEGLVPKPLAEPFIKWLQERRKKMGGNHE